MTRTVLDMEVEGARPRGRPKLRYVDTIRRDIKKNGLMDVNILDCNDWRMAVSRAQDYKRFLSTSRCATQSVLRNDITLHALPRWVWDLIWVEFFFFFIVLAPWRPTDMEEPPRWETRSYIPHRLAGPRLVSMPCPTPPCISLLPPPALLLVSSFVPSTFVGRWVLPAGSLAHWTRQDTDTIK